MNVPPITAMANGTLAPPPVLAHADGNNPNMVVEAVINNGLNLSEAPLTIASEVLCPSVTKLLILSTRMLPYDTAIPTIMIIPIMD